MNKFKYLSEKILGAEISTDPFKHVLIDDFLSEDHLNIIINDKQIHFNETSNTEELINLLLRNNYVIQKFPGCVTDVYEYLRRIKNNDWPHERKGNPVESFGITFRLSKYQNPIIKELVEYMNGGEFKGALETKFNINNPTNIITAIQKNLTKYEISPHPDVREKALTYLLNINKDSSIDNEPIHTHLLRFKEDYQFIPEYWKNNLSKNRCWVPWEWCETGKMTNKNNSIVLFKPDIDTLHAIKLDYNHNKFQRTQLYGNLMGIGNIVPQMNYKELRELKHA